MIHLRYLDRAGRMAWAMAMTPCHSITPTSMRVPGFIGADEHRHRVVLHEVADGETERMQHGPIGHTVPVGTVQDDRFQSHVTRLLVTG